MTVLLERLTIDRSGAKQAIVLSAEVLPEAVGIVAENEAQANKAVAALTGAARPARGRVLVDGHDLLSCPRERARTGAVFLPQGRGTPKERRVKEHLHHCRSLRTRAGGECGTETGFCTELEGKMLGELTSSELRLVDLEIAFQARHPRLIAIAAPLLGLSPMHTDLLLTALRERCSEGAVVFLIDSSRHRLMCLATRLLPESPPLAADPLEPGVTLMLKVERPRDIAVRAQAEDGVLGTFLDPSRPGVLLVRGRDSDQATLAELCTRLVVEERCALEEMTRLGHAPRELVGHTEDLS